MPMRRKRIVWARAPSISGTAEEYRQRARGRGERPAQEEADGIDREPAQARGLAEEIQLLRVENSEEQPLADAADDEGRPEDQDRGLHRALLAGIIARLRQRSGSRTAPAPSRSQASLSLIVMPRR